MNKFIFVFSTLLIISFAEAKPLALIYDGPGSCKPGCTANAVKVAKRSGFRVKRIGPGLKDFSIFNEAKLWVQPGGKSTIAAKAMGPAMIHQIREFVYKGGGYVGFCAGAFIATEKIGLSNESGFGILPGNTELLIKSGPDPRMIQITLANGQTQWMYYAGGPYIKITDDELKSVGGEVIGRYPDGSIAGIQANYGMGKVSVVGFHPEIGFFWKLSKKMFDRDGQDLQFAKKMVKYATH